MAVTELERMPGCRIGAVGPLLVAIFREGATPEALRRLSALRPGHVAAHPRMVMLSVVVGERIDLPTPEVRQLAAELARDFAPYLIASLTVLETRGASAVVARSFLTTLALVTRDEMTHTFASVREAVDWMWTRPGDLAPLLGEADLAQQIEDFARAVG